MTYTAVWINLLFFVLTCSHVSLASSDRPEEHVSVLCVSIIKSEYAICQGETLILKAPEDYETYLWSDGSTEKTLAVHRAGRYSVKAEKTVIIDGLPVPCVKVDSILVHAKPPIPINLGRDTLICAGTTLILDAGTDFFAFVWDDGSAYQTRPVTQSGKYWVTVFDGDCQNTDTIIVSERNFSGLALQTPSDEGFSCLPFAQKATLTGKLLPEYQYTWFRDGKPLKEHSTTIPIKESGDYQVKVRDPLCKKDTLLRFRYAPDVKDQSEVHIPNAFSPNRDNNNDRFRVFPFRLCTFKIEIFNGWGQQVFASNDPHFEWDGSSAGTLLPEGVYVYQIQFSGLHGREVWKTGTINLIY